MLQAAIQEAQLSLG